MLKSIAEVSTELLSFIEALQLSLSNPQKQHVAQVADDFLARRGYRYHAVAGLRQLLALWQSGGAITAAQVAEVEAFLAG